MEIVEAEESLRILCVNHDLMSPEDLYKRRYEMIGRDEKNYIFSSSMLGIDYENDRNNNNLKKEMNRILENYIDKIIINDKSKLFDVKSPLFSNYFSLIKEKEIRDIRRDTIAIISQEGSGLDLFITTSGLITIKNYKFSSLVLFGDIDYKEDVISVKRSERNTLKNAMSDTLCVATGFASVLVIKKIYKKINKPDDFVYKNKNIRMSELREMLIEMFEQVKKSTYKEANTKHNFKDQYSFLLGIGNDDSLNNVVNVNKKSVFGRDSRARIVITGAIRTNDNACVLLGNVLNGKFTIGEGVCIVDVKGQILLSTTLQGIECDGNDKEEIDSTSGIGSFYVETVDRNMIMDAISRGTVTIEKLTKKRLRHEGLI
jgi:hypothetical protein